MELAEINSIVHLDCDTIEEVISLTYWDRVSKFNELPEEFIRIFSNEVYWSSVSRYQTLSESFIREFESEVYWDYIFEYQDLSDEFKEEFKHKLNA